LENLDLVLAARGDQRAALAQPESRISRQTQPDLTRRVGELPGASALRTDAEMAEVPDRRADGLVRAIDDDDAQATTDPGVGRAETDDAGTDDHQVCGLGRRWMNLHDSHCHIH